MEPKHQHYRAAARLVSRGWVKRYWRDDDGNVCLLQALGDVIGLPDASVTPLPNSFLLELDATLVQTGTYCLSRQDRKLRRRALKHGGHELQRVIYNWNDSRQRTRSEVIAVLTATADRLAAREQLWLRDLISRAVRPARGRGRRVVPELWFEFDYDSEVPELTHA